MKLERLEPSCHESKLTFLSCLAGEIAKIAGPRRCRVGSGGGWGGISKGLCPPAFTTRAFEVTRAIVNTASLLHRNYCGLLAPHPSFPNVEACSTRPWPHLPNWNGQGSKATAILLFSNSSQSIFACSVASSTWAVRGICAVCYRSTSPLVWARERRGTFQCLTKATRADTIRQSLCDPPLIT